MSKEYSFAGSIPLLECPLFTSQTFPHPIMPQRTVSIVPNKNCHLLIIPSQFNLRTDNHLYLCIDTTLNYKYQITIYAKACGQSWKFNSAKQYDSYKEYPCHSLQNKFSSIFDFHHPFCHSSLFESTRSFRCTCCKHAVVYCVYFIDS